MWMPPGSILSLAIYDVLFTVYVLFAMLFFLYRKRKWNQSRVCRSWQPFDGDEVLPNFNTLLTFLTNLKDVLPYFKLALYV